MNCRAKTLFIDFMQLCVLTLILLSHSWAETACAQNIGQVVYQNINNSPKFSVYPEPIYKQLIKAKGWQPKAEATAECQHTFSSKKLEPEKCELKLKLGVFESFLSKIYVAFDTSDAQLFQRVQFEPQEGLKFRGLLALQPQALGDRPRPLVILRMGIHGNVDEFLAERFLARIIYQDLGYNLLVLENLTSHGFLKTNEQISIGGIEEGLHTFFVLNLIRYKKLPWVQQVSDVYLMGVSLAGPGVFLANYLDEESKSKTQPRKVVKAVELYCPVVNLAETFQDHEKATVFNAFVDVWNRQRFFELRHKVPQLNDVRWWQTMLDFNPRFMPAAMKWMNENRKEPLLKLETFKKHFPDLVLPKNFVNHVNKSDSWLSLNNFWPIYVNEKTPISIYLTDQDPLVDPLLNAGRIRAGSQPGIHKKTQFTNLKGLHCALAPEYQWPFLIELVKRGFELR